MGKYSIMDRTNSALLVGLTCCAIVSANTSTGIQSFNTAYYATENENSYGNISTVLKEYKIPQKKFKVETEAQNLFGKMREATLSEQRIIQNNIDKISVPTGFNFWD